MSYTSTVNIIGKIVSVDPEKRDLIIISEMENRTTRVRAHALERTGVPYNILSTDDMVYVHGHIGNKGRVIGSKITPAWQKMEHKDFLWAEGVVAQLDENSFILMTFTPANKAVRADCHILESCTDTVTEGSIVRVSGYINEGIIYAERIVTYNSPYDVENNADCQEEEDAE